MATICFDIDGVLADFHRDFLVFLKKELGSEYVACSAKAAKLNNHEGFTRAEFNKYNHKFISVGGYARMSLTRQHYEKALFALIRDGHEICYITSRLPETRKDTIEWLANHGLPIGKIVFTETKSDAAKLFKVSVVIEDRVENIKSLTKNGFPCVLVSRPYNVGVKIGGVPRVTTSKLLYKSIVKLLKERQVTL